MTQDPPTPASGDRLEVHEHSYISGPNARWTPTRNVEHSHWAGGQGHLHPEVGPATFTIDKDEWYAATGLVGGGRKQFSRKPKGEQLPWMPPEERTFKVVFVDRGFTSEIARSTGLTQEQWEADRDCFVAEAAEQAARRAAGIAGAGIAGANVALRFDMEPILIYEDHRNDPVPEPPHRPTMEEEIAADQEAIRV